MEVGDVVFYRPKSLISFCIAKLTGSPYSHVALVVGDGTIIEANRFIKSRVVSFTFNSEEHALYRIEGLTSEQKRSIVLEALALQGMRYDYGQIIGFLFRLLFKWNRDGLFDRANMLICSELIDRVFDSVGIPRKGFTQVGDVTPQDLLKEYEFVLVE